MFVGKKSQNRKTATSNKWLLFAFFVIFATTIATMSLADQPNVDEDELQEPSMAPSMPNSVEPLLGPLMQFSRNIFSAIRGDKQNVIVSPISIHKALNLVLLGANSNSETKQQLLDTLGYGGRTNVTSESQFHELYAKLIEVFEQVNAIGLPVLKRSEAAAAAAEGLRGSSSRRFGDPMPPVVEVWNMVVSKGKSQFKAKYLEQVKKYYHSSVENVRDDAPETKSKLLEKINTWAKEAGFEQQVVRAADLNEQFSAILLSAIRVQAFWFDTFNERMGDNIFYNYGLKDQIVKRGKVLSQTDIKGARFIEFNGPNKTAYKYLHQQMSQSKWGNLFKELIDLEFRVIEVPLQGKVSFTIFEPLNRGQGNELAKLIESLFKPEQGKTGTKLEQVLQLLDTSEAHNEIQYLKMPSFKFNSDVSLKPALKSLGLHRIFDRQNAQLYNITDDPVCISEVKHKAVIEVNKAGLKAAAITQVRVVPLMLVQRSEPINLKVENPFMFMVRYEKVPLFFGQLVHL